MNPVIEKLARLFGGKTRPRPATPKPARPKSAQPKSAQPKSTVPKPAAPKPRRTPKPAPVRPTALRPAPPQEPDSPGRTGATATTDALGTGRVRTAYAPDRDGDPDPGEIVWTWVPFEENDGRGKDRPVLVVAREQGGTLLAVRLSSKRHDGDREWIPIGSGPWDSAGRESWVDLDRVLRVHPDGMRREACALDRARFDRVVGRLKERYGWT